MDKKGLVCFLSIFCVMCIMNIATPLLVDDYFVIYNEPDILSHCSRLVKILKAYYFSWGGRIPGSIPISFFIWKGKEYFNILNAFMFTLLIAEIYWLSNKGKITFSFDWPYIFWIFFSLWAFNASFIDTCLWMSGSCNYLWMVVIVLAFLLPYVNCFFDTKASCYSSAEMTVGMFLLGILAGWSHETTVCWLILSLAYYLYLLKKTHTVREWQVFGFVGVCIGYCLLVFAPGNFSRLVSQTGMESAALVSQSSGAVVSSSRLLYVKLIETSIILYFHLFLWYVIISFFLKYRENFKCQVIRNYKYIIEACVLTSAGSAIIMFFIPTVGTRPSFLGLVFLTIAVASIFRVQKYLSVPIIQEKTIRLFKKLGYLYLATTLFLSLWCNCINGKQWNDVLKIITLEHKNLTNTIIEVNPYFTDRKFDFWLVGTGFHLIDMPVAEDYRHSNNKFVARFYGIKGIQKNKVKRYGRESHVRFIFF